MSAHTDLFTCARLWDAVDLKCVHAREAVRSEGRFVYVAAFKGNLRKKDVQLLCAIMRTIVSHFTLIADSIYSTQSVHRQGDKSNEKGITVGVEAERHHRTVPKQLKKLSVVPAVLLQHMDRCAGDGFTTTPKIQAFQDILL